MLAHGLVAEDGLEHLLGQHRRAAGDADLGPDQAPGVRERDEHEDHTDAIDTVCRDAGRGAPVACPRPHEVEHLALPVADQAVDARSSRSGEALASSGCSPSTAGPPGQQAPGTRTGGGGALRLRR